MDDFQTTVPTDDGTLANTVVYIGAETVLLGSYDAGAGEYTGCTRGFWSSPTRYHRTGDAIFGDVPYWRGRTAHLVRHIEEPDGATAFEVLDRQVIEGIDTAQNGTLCQIDLSGLVSKITDLEINRQATPVSQADHGFAFRGEAIEVDADPGPSGIPQGSGYDSQVFKQDFFANLDRALALQIHDAVIIDPSPGGLFRPALGSKFSKVPDPPYAKPVEEAVYELALYGRKVKAYTDREGLADVRPTQALDYPDNPVAILLAHTLSTARDSNFADTYDVLDRQQSVDVKDLVDWPVQSELAEIAHQKIDHWAVGWDGEPASWWDRGVGQLFRPYGHFWGTDGSGRLKWRRFGYASIQQYDDALDNKVTALQRADDKQLQWRSALGSAVDTVTARVGGVPWQEPDTIEVNGPGGVVKGDANPRRPSALAPGAEWEYDFATQARSEEGKLRVESIATQQLIKNAQALPGLSIRVHAADFASSDVGVGERIVIENLGLKDGVPFIVDASGDRIDLDGTREALVALVTGKRTVVDEHTYELDVRFLNFRIEDVIRWRAPSMEVDSNTDTGANDKLYCAATSQFSFDSTDNNAFYVGDDIDICDGTGAVSQGSFEITAIGDDMTGDFIQIDNSASIGDVSGGIVRLTSYGDYANAAPGSFQNVTLIWTFLADANETLGASGDAAHTYGL